jgi:hypothetical protein
MSNYSISIIVSLFFVNVVVADTSTENEIESIEVIGKKPLFLLKKDFIKAEDNFYDAYNALVKDREMQMDCKMQSIHDFTRVKKRICVPNFFETIKSDEMDKAVDRVGGRTSISNIMNAVPDNASARRRVGERNKDMANLMSELIKKNKSLAEKYLAYLSAKNKYETAKKTED